MGLADGAEAGSASARLTNDAGRRLGQAVALEDRAGRRRGRTRAISLASGAEPETRRGSGRRGGRAAC